MVNDSAPATSGSSRAAVRRSVTAPERPAGRRRRTALALVVLVFPLLLAGCGFLFLNPFPTFIGGVEQVLSLAGLPEFAGIDGAEEAGTRYDLAVIGSGASMRLLLKVEPPSSTETGFTYRGRIIVFDDQMNVVGLVAPDTSLDYLSRPYAYTHNPGELLVGYSVYNTADYTFNEKLSPHGLTGFAVSRTGTVTTHLFSTPSGAYSGFELQIRNYIANDPWGLVDPLVNVTAVNIIPTAEWPPLDSEEITTSGYQLLGLHYEEFPDDSVTFLLSRPSGRHVVAVRLTLADLLSGAVPDLLATETAQGLVRIDNMDRPLASVDPEGFFLLQRDGWFVRYLWDPVEGATEVARVVGDTSFTRRYAFYAEGDVFYRFDPASLTLTRIRGWWP